MKTNGKQWVLALSAFALTLATAPGALAACGGQNLAQAHPTGMHLHSGPARFMPAALLKEGINEDDYGGVSIVGMWHVLFTEQAVNGASVTASTLDDSLVVWHSDGTEIMSTARPPQDGNFCMGVWARTGPRQYFLNHIPWRGNDPFGNPIDGVQLLEEVTLSPDGDHYSGKFTFKSYDTNGNLQVTITGVLTATRITTSTPFSSLL